MASSTSFSHVLFSLPFFSLARSLVKYFELCFFYLRIISVVTASLNGRSSGDIYRNKKLLSHFFLEIFLQSSMLQFFNCSTDRFLFYFHVQ